MNKIAKTINIYLIAEMQREDLTKSFSYMIYIEDRKIKIIPTGINTQFIDVYLSPEFVTANNEEELLKIFGINLSANIELNGTENDDFHVTIDELGQIVITLDVNLEDTDSYGEFIEVVENKDIDLITEAETQPLDDIDTDEKEEVDVSSIEAKVLDEGFVDVEQMLSELTKEWSLSHGQVATECPEEHEEALEILSDHYDYVEDEGLNDKHLYTISFSKPMIESLNEAKEVLPFSDDAAEELHRFMSEKQMKKTALNRLRALISSTELTSQLNSLEDESDVRETVKNYLSATLSDYDRDRSDFKLEISNKARKLFDDIIDTDFSTESLKEEIEDVPEVEWVATFDNVNESLIEDASELPSNQVVINAPDLDTAAKYAQQQARINAKENPNWDDAELVAIKKVDKN